jgi:hypothetical protein
VVGINLPRGPDGPVLSRQSSHLDDTIVLEPRPTQSKTKDAIRHRLSCPEPSAPRLNEPTQTSPISRIYPPPRPNIDNPGGSSIISTRSLLPPPRALDLRGVIKRFFQLARNFDWQRSQTSKGATAILRPDYMRFFPINDAVGDPLHVGLCTWEHVIVFFQFDFSSPLSCTERDFGISILCVVVWRFRSVGPGRRALPPL